MEKKGMYPCHVWGMENAGEAYEALRGELVKDYGEETCLGDGTVLHDNYMWDEGGRCLVRCKECGGLVLRQASEYHSFSDDDGDGYYRDWVPVSSVEEADLLNLLWDVLEMENHPFRGLRKNNSRLSWTGGEEPRPYDPEELKRMIRAKYSEVNREALEEKMGKVGEGE